MLLVGLPETENLKLRREGRRITEQAIRMELDEELAG